MSVTAFWGFSYTYFTPVLAGAYPKVSPAVHVHGWSFFLWFLLLLVRHPRLRVYLMHAGYPKLDEMLAGGRVRALPPGPVSHRQGARTGLSGPDRGEGRPPHGHALPEGWRDPNIASGGERTVAGAGG
jgi:hypothetical protein